ncbi:DUF1616 domain-containing protein [Chloroflexota bacterium]
MRIKIENGLLPLNLLVILLMAAIIFFPYNVLHIIVGFLFVLFFPGFALMAALYPGRVAMSGVERIALSLGLSIVAAALIGLILNCTWGLRPESILYSTASFIFISSVLAWFRQKRLTKEERYGIELHLALPSWRIGVRDKALTVILVLAILGAVGMMGYAIVTPGVGEKFTEFYILRTEGEAAGYPTELVVGNEAKVIVGIANHEYETVDYRIEVRINEARSGEVEPIALEHGEEREKEISFMPEMAGKDQKVEFLLYKNGEIEPCLEPLRLLINVKE